MILKILAANQVGDFLTQLCCSQHLSISLSADSQLIAQKHAYFPLSVDLNPHKIQDNFPLKKVGKQYGKEPR